MSDVVRETPPYVGELARALAFSARSSTELAVGRIEADFVRPAVRNRDGAVRQADHTAYPVERVRAARAGRRQVEDRRGVDVPLARIPPSRATALHDADAGAVPPFDLERPGVPCIAGTRRKKRG